MDVQLGGFISRRHKGIRASRRIEDPLQFSGQALMMFLKKEGIKVKHGVHRGSLPLEDNRVTLHTHTSTELKN